MKPRILLIIEGTYPWYRGGVSEWVYQYLLGLSDYHFHILQVATDEFLQLDPYQALYPIPDNVRSFSRVHPPKFEQSWQYEKDAWFASVAPNLSNLSFELIHVTNTGFAGWLGSEISKIRQIPLVLTEHALYWKEVEKGAVALECGFKIEGSVIGKHQIMEDFKEIASEVYEQAETVVSVSKININEQKALGAKSPVYIPNGISTDLIEKEIQLNNDPVIGWVGRCAEMKNPLRFFDLVDDFRKQATHSHPQFIMMLSDANEKKLQQEVIQRGKCYDEVELIWNTSAIEHMSRMDALVITSHNESQPLVMFEALAKNALPFGWEVGDVTNAFAITVDSSTSDAELVQKIDHVITNPNILKELIAERKVTLMESHTWEIIFEEYDQLFSTIGSVISQ
ncbi:glycosyltransferase [Balneola vulgaris]|uniref:glycosyltransferase n=1 Tax=Balneola vulgaris TaxID=287535 RepID=UPI000371AE89|nr:DUF3492 domain-containing protein [Balneola vulgaris]